MAQRLNISIPDDLNQRLQPFKEQLNISHICQNAISKEVNKRESLKTEMKGIPDMDQIVERLAKEKKEIEEVIYKKGKEDGEEWAKTAFYADLYFAASIIHVEEMFDSPATRRHFEKRLGDIIDQGNSRFDGSGDLYEYLNEEAFPCGEYGRISFFPDNQYESVYFQGWKDAVEIFWNEIKDIIGIESDFKHY